MSKGNWKPARSGSWTYANLMKWSPCASKARRSPPLSVIRWQDFRPVTDKPVVFTCNSGRRTKNNSDLLEQLAAGEAWQMEGGATAWDKAGLPVVRSRRSLPMFRQIQIGAGGMVLLGLALSLAWPQWLWLSAFVGAGLVFAGVTGFCGLGLLLARMPWNKK